ncbi:hypothetical protein F383_21012 [Gossypium arboreum]|uniref:Uncharacterized protein n=1 Tax=Gossypium arboreum TaxID=29729 RepID=A0A0B0MNB1_GOSAR|nr:hypothetical protein F383_21012 [Gossypium arboreum]
MFCYCLEIFCLVSITFKPMNLLSFNKLTSVCLIFLCRLN